MASRSSLRTVGTVKDASRWKELASFTREGFYKLETADTGGVPVRLFLTPALLQEAETTLYQQIINATRFPGAKLVAITPDTHYGYGVPVGSVLLTDAKNGAVAMGPVGYDIGCGMMSARSSVPVEAATPAMRMKFNRAVMERVDLGAGVEVTDSLDWAKRNSNLWFEEGPSIMSRNMERTLTEAVPSGIASPSPIDGKFRTAGVDARKEE